jgi:hypothetical protein
MTPTLDTAAIRKRFEQAIIGIRQDGTMAVLVPLINARCLDLVRGDRYSPTRLQSHFVSLIRPGDRVEVSDGDGYEIAVYRGVTGGTLFPFSAIAWDSDDPDGDTYRYIRPLPAAETEAVEIGPKYAGDDSKDFWRRVNALPEPDHMAAYSVGVALQNMEGTALNFINRCERNAASSEITVEPEPNPLLSRLDAEQELAAIRAEMEQVQR